MSRQENPDALPPVRVAVSFPTHSVVPYGFAYDLAQMIGQTVAKVPEETLSIILNASEGTYIHTMRQTLVEAALKTDSTHILWIDTDMRFPPETMAHLLSRKKPIVGINYAQRRVSPEFVAVKKRTGKKLDAVKLITSENSTGLEIVEGIGFGVLLMETGIFSKLGSPPWFQNIWDSKLKRWVGEDMFFCMAARKAGLKIFVDHDLSKHCAHIGQFEYETSHAEFWHATEAPDGTDS